MLITLCIKNTDVDGLMKVLVTSTKHNLYIMVKFMVFNVTFNNISVISWMSVLLVEETGVSGENRQPVASH